MDGPVVIDMQFPNIAEQQLDSTVVGVVGIAGAFSIFLQL
jgi:hypothetical protein